MSNRFLLFSRRVFNLLGWAALGIGPLAALVIWINSPESLDLKLTRGVVALFLGGFYFIAFRTVSGLIRLLLDIHAKLHS